MKTEIEKTIEILKDRVQLNKQIIDENREILKNVISQPLSNERTDLFIQHIKISMGLYTSNFLYNKLQNELYRAVNQKDGLKTFGMMSLS